MPDGMAKTDRPARWLRGLPARFTMLIQRAPFPNWFSIGTLALSLLVFLWGPLDAFVPWPTGWEVAALPTVAAKLFPGPAIALVGMALVIAPLSVLTFLFDGLDISIDLGGLRLFRRPPVLSVII